MTPIGRAAFVLTIAVGAALAPRPARAWDDFGHMEVAAVAYPLLNAKAKAEVGRLLALNPRYANWIVGAKPEDRARAAFMRATTWADSIRADPDYDKRDAPDAATEARNIGYADHFAHHDWHFIDQPFAPDGTPVAPAPAPNIATQIPVLRAALASPKTSDDVRSYDLVWLLHLVGDVHQPLHCATRFDAVLRESDHGGNKIKVSGNHQPPICDDPRYCPFGPPPALHYLVDDIEGESYAIAPVVEAAGRLPKAPAKEAAVLDVSVWIAEGFELARTKVYVAPIGIGPGPFTITPAYEAAIAALGKQRIALAGARLANLLNDALGR
jgi:hypothetical protein